MKQDREQMLAARVPKDLIRQLERAAAAVDRTRSAEVRVRLAHSLQTYPVLTVPVAGSVQQAEKVSNS